jgi:electron transfer flavoprotein alpha subunit
MAKVLVIAEQVGGEVKKGTYSVLTLANALAAREGGGVAIATIGAGAAAAAGALTGFGAEKVYSIEGAAFEHYLAQPFAAAIAQLAEASGAAFVLTSASTFGKDCFPRIAAKLGAGMIAECVGLADGGLFKRPMYAGNIIARVKSNTAVTVMTVRVAEFDATAPAGGASPVEAFSASVEAGGATFVKFDATVSERPDLTDADVVVAGGRGLKDEQGFFGLMEPLADALGAAIGASRAAVDSGFCPNDFQIGQTGKVVAPNLYIAVAISGAIQHLAGMKNSKVIVAINRDEEAPIFQVSDYGLVADAFKAVPELVERIKAL